MIAYVSGFCMYIYYLMYYFAYHLNACREALWKATGSVSRLYCTPTRQVTKGSDGSRGR